MQPLFCGHAPGRVPIIPKEIHMQKFVVALISSLLAAAVFAAGQEAQTPGSEGPKTAAEAKHMKKQHGMSAAAKQPEAQAPGSEGPKAKAEAKHMAKKHGSSGAATQPEAQRAGSEAPKEQAEAEHMKKPHGNAKK